MMSFKLKLEMPDDTTVWVNMLQIVKMQKDAAGRYFIFMSNGEVFEINHSAAKRVEECFEG
ncbi:MAG: hypothetical protein E7534_06410 [Ruminococcaceae bacterium]|nr:hypothetical protein [Oscillospiraceae bacterium]MBQ2780013.1 hypothetical protein [Clostridia bacterium]MBQ7302193.1 hypothetical protein [Clostridia bacterium]